MIYLILYNSLANSRIGEVESGFPFPNIDLLCRSTLKIRLTKYHLELATRAQRSLEIRSTIDLARLGRTKQH